jgi:hypothetical protein
MDVEGRARSDLEQVVRHKLAVGGQQQTVRRVASQERSPFVRAEAARGLDRDVMLASPRRHRRRARLEATAGRPIGLADDEQLVAQLRQPGEQRDAE